VLQLPCRNAYALQLALQRVTLKLTEAESLDARERSLFAVTLRDARLQAARDDDIVDIRWVILHT